MMDDEFLKWQAGLNLCQSCARAGLITWRSGQRLCHDCEPARPDKASEFLAERDAHIRRLRAAGVQASVIATWIRLSPGRIAQIDWQAAIRRKQATRDRKSLA